MTVSPAILRRRRFGGFSPLSLFSSGQDGAIWPPYDSTAVLTTDTGSTLATPTDSVGRIEDVHLGRELGPELFSAFTILGDGWTANGGGSWTCDGTQTSFSSLSVNLGLTAGVSYRVVYSVSRTSGSVRAQVGSGNLENFSGASGVREAIVSGNSASLILQGSESFIGTVSDFSVRELKGNHLTQSSAALRGSYGIVPEGGRRNQLTHTDELDNAAWSTSRLSVTAGTITLTSGDIAAFKLIEDTSENTHIFDQRTGSGLGAAGDYTYQFIAQADEIAAIQVQRTSVDTNSFDHIFDLTNGTATGGGEIEQVGPSAYRCSGQVEHTGTDTGAFRIALRNAAGNTFYLGDGSSGVLIARPQLEPGSTATPYQRVGASDLDVTEAGVTNHRYVAMDLTDDIYPSQPFPNGLTGQVLVAGRGGQYVSDVNIAAAGTFEIGPNSWTDGTPGILDAVTDANLASPGLIGATIREGSFSDAELANQVAFYKRKGAKGLLVPGPELVTNGTFDSDSDWTADPLSSGTPWVISGGVASIDGTQTSASDLLQSISTVSGGVYLLSFDFVSGDPINALARTKGISFGGNVSVTTAGTNKFVFGASATSLFITFRASGGAISTIDNVSVQQLIPQEEL